MDFNMVQNQQDWPYWLTQGAKGFDPMQLGSAQVGPEIAPGMAIGTPGQTAAPQQAPVRDTLSNAATDSLSPQMPAGITMGPPKDAAEHAERKQGWLDTLSKMLENPEAKQALLRVGLHMMQPIPVGQTAGGHVAKSILGGADYLAGATQQSTENKRKGAESTAKIGLENAQADFYKRRKDGGSGGGGTAAKVQQVNQIAQALIKSHPDQYAGNESQAILDAQELMSSVQREQIAGRLAASQILPGIPAGPVVSGAAEQARTLRAAGALGKHAAGAAPILPPTAAAALKEGVQTRFANGQVWMLKNGVPQQVQ
jgi:hypothetical protein